MEILYLLIPLSIVLVFFIAVIFWMSVRGGQFEDLEGPGYRVLMDDDKPLVTKASTRTGFDPGQGNEKTTSPE